MGSTPWIILHGKYSMDNTPWVTTYLPCWKIFNVNKLILFFYLNIFRINKNKIGKRFTCRFPRAETFSFSTTALPSLGVTYKVDSWYRFDFALSGKKKTLQYEQSRRWRTTPWSASPSRLATRKENFLQRLGIFPRHVYQNMCQLRSNQDHVLRGQPAPREKT